MKKIEFIINLNDEITATKFASKIVYEASQYMSDMTLSIGKNIYVDLKSILGVVSLGISNGRTAIINISGEDEDKAYKNLVKLVSK